MNPNFKEHTTLGRTGLSVSRIGVASGYGVPSEAVDRAYEEFGVNYFYWDRRKAGMRDSMMEMIGDYGGSFSAEHGIGAEKRETLAGFTSATRLNLMRAIKTAIDPKGVMNPGKVLL